MSAVEPPAPAENEDSDDEKGEDDFELLDDNKAGDMKPRILNGTQRQARRIRRLEVRIGGLSIAQDSDKNSQTRPS